MDHDYHLHIHREEALALRSQLSAFVEVHEKQLFDAQQHLHQPTDATHWSRHEDIVTVQLADTPTHSTVGSWHQPRQRHQFQQTSFADVMGRSMMCTDPLLFRISISLVSLTAEIGALADEGRRCYGIPLALVGDDNENCYTNVSWNGVDKAGVTGKEATCSGRLDSNLRSTSLGMGYTFSSSPPHQRTTILEEEKLLHSTGALLSLLQDMWMWHRRVQDVVAHSLFQLARIYRGAEGERGGPDAPPLTWVRLTSFWDALGDLLGAVLLVDEVISQNISFQEGVKVMQHCLAQQALDAEHDATLDEEGEILRELLSKMQTDLLDTSLLATVASQPFDRMLCSTFASGYEEGTSVPAPPPLRENVALCKEWMAVLTACGNDVGVAQASPRAAERAERLLSLCGLSFFAKAVFLSTPPHLASSTAARPSSAAATISSKLVTTTLVHLSTQLFSWKSTLPLVPLEGLYALCPHQWWPQAFPAEFSMAAAATGTGTSKDGMGALPRRIITEACQISATHFLGNLTQWTAQVEQWAAVDMPSAIPIDAPLCRRFIQRTVLLLQQGMAHARTIHSGLRHLLLLHHVAEVALTLPMVHGVLRGVLLLQRIADAYHSAMGVLATAQEAMVQSIVYVLEKHLHRVYVISCSGKRSVSVPAATTAELEQQHALRCALQLLRKPLTTDVMACLTLMLEVAFNREGWPTGDAAPAAPQERNNVFIALTQLKAVLTYQQTLSEISNVAFLYFHREALYPLFFKCCYEHTLLASSLPHLVCALSDCRPLIMSAQHVKKPDETLMTSYVQFVRDCIVHELVQPLCTDIENQLRLRAHDAVLGEPYRTLRPSVDPAGRDLTRFTRLPPFRFFHEWMHLATSIQHYLSTQFYNLNALMPNDWKSYEEMRNVALRMYHLHITDGHLPSGLLDQGLDVLVITDNIEKFVLYYTYNLNEQVFIQRPALTPSKHLHTLNTRHIANSIRTHGTGVMNTTVNYVYKYLLKKMAILTHFLYDDYVRSHLLKDARVVRQRKKDHEPEKYPVDRADQLIREMDRLGVAQDGVSFLEKARQLIGEMGNALGFMRMMRCGGLRAVAEGARCLPLPVAPSMTSSSSGLPTATAETAPLATRVAKTIRPSRPQDGEDSTTDDEVRHEKSGVELSQPEDVRDGVQEQRQRLRLGAADAVSLLDSVVQGTLPQLSDGSEYFPLLRDAIGRRLRRSAGERYAHLHLLYLLIPALTNLNVAYAIQEKEKLLKQQKHDGIFSDDGFAVGATFLLVLFRAYDAFDALHWFDVKKAQLRSKLESVQGALSTATVGASVELNNLHLTTSALRTHLREYTNLENAFTSSRLIFSTASTKPALPRGSTGAEESP